MITFYDRNGVETIRDLNGENTELMRTLTISREFVYF